MGKSKIKFAFILFYIVLCTYVNTAFCQDDKQDKQIQKSDKIEPAKEAVLNHRIDAAITFNNVPQPASIPHNDSSYEKDLLSQKQKTYDTFLSQLQSTITLFGITISIIFAVFGIMLTIIIAYGWIVTQREVKEIKNDIEQALREDYSTKIQAMSKELNDVSGDQFEIISERLNKLEKSEEDKNILEKAIKERNPEACKPQEPEAKKEPKAKEEAEDDLPPKTKPSKSEEDNIFGK